MRENDYIHTPKVDNSDLGRIKITISGPPGSGKTILRNAIIALIDGEITPAKAEVSQFNKINGARPILFQEEQ